MSVKKLTNRQVVSRGLVNRGSQLSFRGDKSRTGNRSQTITPGKDSTKNYSVTLKDIDTSVLTHIKNVIKPSIREANETIKVPVLWANEERWKMVRKNGVLRDKNGSIILPVIIIRRTDTAFNEAMPLSFDHDVEGKYIQVARNSRWSKDNRYDRFSVQTGTKPAQEAIVTGMPDFVVCNYEITMLTNFIEQMNGLSELFLEHLETYWGGSEEYKFLSSLEGTISDATEMTVEGERLIKNTFTTAIKAYVIPEFTDNVLGKTSETSRVLTPSRIVFGFEGDATNEQVGLPSHPNIGVDNILSRHTNQSSPQSLIRKLPGKPGVSAAGTKK